MVVFLRNIPIQVSVPTVDERTLLGGLLFAVNGEVTLEDNEIEQEEGDIGFMYSCMGTDDRWSTSY